MSSPPTIFVKNLYKIVKILDKFNVFVNFRSMTKRFTRKTARKAIWEGLEKRFKSCDGKGFKKNDFFAKSLIKSTVLGFDPETVPGP